MTEHHEQLAQQQTQDRRPRCPTCAAFPRLMGAYLNSAHGKSIRLYECEKCGERIWNG